jgi:hypothetical protein
MIRIDCRLRPKGPSQRRRTRLLSTQSLGTPVKGMKIGIIQRGYFYQGIVSELRSKQVDEALRL